MTAFTTHLLIGSLNHNPVVNGSDLEFPRVKVFHVHDSLEGNSIMLLDADFEKGGVGWYGGV